MKVIIKNSDLVFQRKHIPEIVYKDYWVRQSGQFVRISDLGASVVGLGFNNYKGRYELYINTNTTSSSYSVLYGRGGYLVVNSSGTTLAFRNNGAGPSITIPEGASDHYVEFDNKLGTADLDGTTDSFTSPGASALNNLWLFASGSNEDNATAIGYSEGRFKFKRLRLYNATTNALLCDIRPALVDNVPCLYDSVSETKLFSADGTTMVVEDAE